jgi:aldose 1-epimerase
MYYVNQYVARQRELNVITVEYDDIKAVFLDIGASIIDIQTKDYNEVMESVVVKYDNLRSYFKNRMYLNTTVGPTSGRIKNGRFVLNNQEIQLDLNDGSNHLHGGKEGFSYRRFRYEVIEEENETKVIFRYTQKEALSLYPGTKEIKVVYTVKNTEILVEYFGKSDQDTLLNMTNHTYFNLSGNSKAKILDHTLYLNADKVMDLDDTYAPYTVKSVKKLSLDFRKEKVLSSVFSKKLKDSMTKGIDHPFILEERDFDTLQARLFDPASKRVLDVYTTYPCIVVYTHNFPTKSKIMYQKHEQYYGICLETQYEPNGINIDGLHDSVLLKGDQYYEKTLFRFGVKE